MKLLTSCVSLDRSFLLLAVLVALGSPIGRKVTKKKEEETKCITVFTLEFSTKERALLPRKWETLSLDQTSSGYLE